MSFPWPVIEADQILNHLAKFRWMYNAQVETPMVIRTPVGGRRGYGPTHSQSIENRAMATAMTSLSIRRRM